MTRPMNMPMNLEADGSACSRIAFMGRRAGKQYLGTEMRTKTFGVGAGVAFLHSAGGGAVRSLPQLGLRPEPSARGPQLRQQS